MVNGCTSTLDILCLDLLHVVMVVCYPQDRISIQEESINSSLFLVFMDRMGMHDDAIWPLKDVSSDIDGMMDQRINRKR